MPSSSITSKIIKRITIFLIIIIIILASIDWWLPRYLILEEGITIDYKFQSLFQCRIDNEVKLPLGFFPKGKVKELVQNEFIELIDGSGDSLAFTLDEEDDFLTITFEQDLGNYPFNRLLQNFRRQEKEQQLQGLLQVISEQENTKFCINPKH